MFRILMGFGLRVCAFKTQEGILKIYVFHPTYILPQKNKTIKFSIAKSGVIVSDI